MKQEFIVLREACSGNRNAGKGRAGKGRLRFSLPRIELEELDSEDIAKIQRESGFISLTPNMPACLIDSVSHSEVAGSGIGNGKSAWGVEAVGADCSRLSGAGMVAAILDTGIDRAHPAFSGMNLVEQDFSGTGNGDRNGHGTHCAGTLFGQDVNGLRIGVARGVDRALVAKVFDDSGKGDSWRVFQALQWAAEHGANVISMSLSISFASYMRQLIDSGCPQDRAATFALEAYHSTVAFYKKYIAFLRLRSRAAIVVAGVGDSTRQTLKLPWQQSVEPLSVVGGITSVGALEQGEDGHTVAEFSNPNPDIIAPGVEILSARAGTDRLIALSGTSVAAPYAAGIALLWGEYLSERRSFTSFDLEAYLTTSGVLSNFEPGVSRLEFGKGLIQAPCMIEREDRNLQEIAARRARNLFETKPMKLRELLALQSGPKMKWNREIKSLRRLARARK